MNIAVIGATGLVGRNILKVLEQRKFPVTELIPAASERSSGNKILFKGKEYSVCTLQQAMLKKPQIAIFSAGSEVSAIWAPEFAKAGCYVIDNSAFWRMHPDKKLVIPEINGDVIEKGDYIIANPNCSTIQMLIAVAELHKRYAIKRIVVSTYQCITGTGKKAIDQMEKEREKAVQLNKKSGNGSINNILEEREHSGPYPYRIDLNLLPHIDKFFENGYTGEEMKMVNETRKIMRDDNIKVSPTAVRVPVLGGHAESINLEFEKPISQEGVYNALQNTRGVILQDNVSPNGDSPNPAIGKKPESGNIRNNGNCSAANYTLNSLEALPYPMPLYTEGRDEVFVGRVRIDPSVENGVNLWCVADNLRKGAATNAVQIAELLLEKAFLS